MNGISTVIYYRNMLSATGFFLSKSVYLATLSSKGLNNIQLKH